MNVKRGARESRFTLLLKLHYLLATGQFAWCTQTIREQFMLPFATKLIPVGFPTLGSLYSSQMVSHFLIKRQTSINQSQIIFFTGQMLYFSPHWEQICGLAV